MDVSATLTEELVEELSNPDRTLDETAGIFDRSRNARGRLNAQQVPVDTRFEESLCFKNKLDELEVLGTCRSTSLT